MNENPWYALKVKPRFERSVVAHLRGRGFDPFLPVYTAKRCWSDRIKSIELPLFSGYLFCQFDLNNRLPILTAPGVNFIVGVGRAPQAVSEHEMNAIRAIVGSGLYYEPYPYLNVGELVRIEKGSLAGLVGRVTEVKNSTRIVISINMLMRSVSTEIDRKWISPVERSGIKHYLYPQPA